MTSLCLLQNIGATKMPETGSCIAEETSLKGWHLSGHLKCSNQDRDKHD